MSRSISDATKQKRGMGTGSGAGYLSYLTTREFNSLGTTADLRDWKTGRNVSCMSQGEMKWYYILRWDDNNIDIREQVPLDNDITVAIAEALGIRHPGNNSHIMTTDFVVTEAGSEITAYSVKYSRDCLTERDRQKLTIEALFWKLQKVEFKMLYTVEANTILAGNIRTVVRYYDLDKVRSEYDLIKHKIATKEYSCDLEHEYITAEFLERVKEENTQ